MLSTIWKPRHSEGFSSSHSDSLPTGIWQVLEARGIKDPDKIKDLISPSLKDLRSPESLKDMDKATDRLIKAFKSQQKILIYGDFDLDGTSGVALLKSGFEALGFQNIDHYQPLRLTEGYGVHVHAIEEFHKKGIDLIVTVDVGITDIKAVKRAGELGLDVIVTDHHLPKEKLPEAYAIVNPNQAACNSGLGHLCGAGVGFFLILALKKKMKVQSLLKDDFNPKFLLDVFTIATLTDLVPLKEENRVLVKHGLIELQNTKRRGLQVLLKKLGLDGRPLSSSDVSISFAPKLNALSRMEKNIRPIDLYLIETKEEAEALVDEVMENNALRIRLQREAEEEALEKALSCLNQGFILVSSPNFHKGVIGLVATKLAREFNLPSFVGSLSAESGQITGSARVPHEGFSVLDALNFSKESLIRHGGHSAAAGFEFSQDQEEVLRSKLKEFFSQDSEAKPCETIYDTELKMSDLNDHFMKWHEALEPFGKDFQIPLFLFRSVEIQSIFELKGGHMKLQFKDSFIKSIWFNPPKESNIMPKSVVDILAQVQWNFFRGQKTLQLVIKDLQLKNF